MSVLYIGLNEIVNSSIGAEYQQMHNDYQNMINEIKLKVPNL
jgi:hypothetical protein